MKVASTVAIFFISTLAHAELIQGIEFPDGAKSFADAVTSYSPGAGVTAAYQTPLKTLGVPDYSPYNGYAALGNQGTLVLRFLDNSLTTSGTSAHDLWIFEVGEDIEATSVYISQDGVSWIYVGATNGGTRGIDIDSYIGQGVVAGEKYSFVKLVDLAPNTSSSPYAGADIDAVAAISSAAPVCNLVNEAPAVYEKSTGLLTVPLMMADGQCFEIKLQGTSGLDIDDATVFTKSSLIIK